MQNALVKVLRLKTTDGTTDGWKSRQRKGHVLINIFRLWLKNGQYFFDNPLYYQHGHFNFQMRMRCRYVERDLFDQRELTVPSVSWNRLPLFTDHRLLTSIFRPIEILPLWLYSTYSQSNSTQKPCCITMKTLGSTPTNSRLNGNAMKPGGKQFTN